MPPPSHSDRLNSARRHFDAGRLSEAEAEARLALNLNSSSVDTNVLLGVILAKTARLAEAALHLQMALATDPNHHDGLLWQAMVLHSLGDAAEAVGLLRQVVALYPDDFEAQNLLGICCLRLGRAADAEAAFTGALALQPKAPEVFANLGLARRLRNDGEGALSAFRLAVELGPNRPNNYLQLFKQLQQMSRWKEAIECLETGATNHPKSLALAEALAIVYGRRHRSLEAESIFKQIEPLGAAPAAAYATWLQEEGRFTESVAVLERSIERHPVQGLAFHGLADAKHFLVGGGSLAERASALLDNPELDDKGRMHLMYASGKALDHSGDYRRAMEAFDRANELAFQSYPACLTFDPAAVAEEPSLNAETYSKDAITSLHPGGLRSDKPIFIVGMIRSGTTLLDRILSSHPDVSSAGEQPFWYADAETVHRRLVEMGPNPDELKGLATRYLQVLEDDAGPSPYITDKMPLNYRRLGLIHLALPDARIVHIRRDPLDTCLSIYMTFFHGGPNFTYNKDNIVAFYRAYLAYMAHWRAALPKDRLLEVDYEAIVANPESETRKILEFCGLSWNAACLSHEANRSQVATPSRWQARQPTYTTSVNRWHRYEPWLGAFRDLVGVSHL